MSKRPPPPPAPPRKSRGDLIGETIGLERTAIKFKKGLHLAKKCIEEMNSGDPKALSSYKEFDAFIAEHGLHDL